MMFLSKNTTEEKTNYEPRSYFKRSREGARRRGGFGTREARICEEFSISARIGLACECSE
jgi:hypothetical protein